MPPRKFSPRLTRAEIRDLGAAARMVQQCGEMLSRTNWAAAPACLTLLQSVLTTIAAVYNRREQWLPENYPSNAPGGGGARPDESGEVAPSPAGAGAPEERQEG